MIKWNYFFSVIFECFLNIFGVRFYILYSIKYVKRYIVVQSHTGRGISLFFLHVWLCVSLPLPFTFILRRLCIHRSARTSERLSLGPRVGWGARRLLVSALAWLDRWWSWARKARERGCCDRLVFPHGARGNALGVWPCWQSFCDSIVASQKCGPWSRSCSSTIPAARICLSVFSRPIASVHVVRSSYSKIIIKIFFRWPLLTRVLLIIDGNASSRCGISMKVPRDFWYVCSPLPP